jgi:hypothetical protein
LGSRFHSRSRRFGNCFNHKRGATMFSISHWGLFEGDVIADKETIYFAHFEDGEWWWSTCRDLGQG